MIRTTTALLLVSTVLLGSSAMSGQGASHGAVVPPLTGPGEAPLQFKAVRAEYVDLSGNRDETDTVCHITNTSGTATLVLREVYVLGQGGVQQILGVDTSLKSVSLPPLGSVELAIDSNIPGVTPETELNQNGVASVIVSWLGPAAALRLTSVIHQELPGNDDGRMRFEVEGYDLTP